MKFTASLSNKWRAIKAIGRKYYSILFCFAKHDNYIACPLVYSAGLLYNATVYSYVEFYMVINPWLNIHGEEEQPY